MHALISSALCSTRSSAVRRGALAALLLALPALTPRAAAAQSERRTLDGSAVSIYNLVGDVRVEPGSGADVVIEVTRRGRDASKLRLETREIRGRNTLVIVYPDGDIVYDGSRDRDSRRRWGSSSSEMRVNDDGTWGGDGRWDRGRRVRIRSSGDGNEVWADLRILVPTGKRVDVNLGVGELSADRVNADLTLDVASAHVTVSGTRGKLSVDAGSGGVELRDVNADDLNVDTGSGGVSVSGVSGGRCSIDTGSGGITGERMSCDEVMVEAGSGSIRLDDVRAPSATVESGSGGVRLGLRTAPRNLHVESGSGGVTVTMPPGVGAEVDIQTGSGGIETDFAISTSRVARNHVRGRIGDGSGRIYIETGSGSVRLRKTD